MDRTAVPTEALGKRELLGRLGPFAAAAFLAFATIPLPPNEGHRSALSILGFAITVGIVIAATRLWGRRRSASWIASVPAFAYFIVVVLLRHAEGGGRSGFGPLVLLPLFWLALYGTRSQLIVGFVLMAASLTIPILIFGDPEYPTTEWRRAIVWVAIAPLICLTAQQIVQETRRRATALANSESQVRAVTEAALDGIVTIDGSARVESVNTAAANMFGYKPEETVGLSVQEFWAPGNIEPVLEEIAASLGTGVSYRSSERELVGKRRDGALFPVEVNIAQVGAEAGTKYVAMMRDITERKRVEQLQNEFLSVASHELRTPLTSINGALGLLAGGVLDGQPDKKERTIAIAAENTDRLMRLVNDMLDLERIQAGRLELNFAPVQVLTLLSRTRETMQPMADEAGIKLEVDGDAISLEADEDRLLQVLTNLVGNAIKFSPDNSTVTLRAEEKDGGALLMVQDRGRGIPIANLTSIFERFQQVDMSDQRKKGGTGLGLAICKAIVEQHGGRIWVESEPDNGSTFFTFLPRSQGAR